MSVEVFEDHSPDVDITFTKEDLRDVVPHNNDPIVISLVTARELGRCAVLADFRKVTVISRPAEAIWGLLIRFCG